MDREPGVEAGLIAGAAADLSVRSSFHAAPLLYMGGAPDRYMTAFKGEFTERLMDRAWSRGFLGGERWVPGTPANVGRTGIDGLYFRTDRRGNINNLLVSEAKYGSSRLGWTHDGRQMGEAWTARRLERTAFAYSELATDLAGARRVLRPPRSRAVSVPLREGDFALVWESRSGRLRWFAERPSVSLAEVQGQAKQASLILHGAAEGRVTFRKRVFRLANEGDVHLLQVDRLDSAGKTVERSLVRGRWGQLKPEMQRALRREIEASLVRQGHDPRAAERLSERGCHDPEFLRRMQRHGRWTWRAGLDRYAVVSTVGGGLFGVVGDLWSQSQTAGPVKWSQTARAGALGSTAAFAGHYAGAQFQTLLVGTEVGRTVLRSLPLPTVFASRATLLGGTAAGVLASALFSYAGVLTGHLTWQQANRAFVSGVAGLAAGAGAQAGTLALVGQFGYAGTGAAIKGLAGAAAHKATMAALGGLVGGGMAEGAIVLAGISGVAIVAATLALSYMFRVADEAQRRRLVEGRVAMLERGLGTVGTA